MPRGQSRRRAPHDGALARGGAGLGRDQPRLAQEPHRAAHDDGIGPEAFPQGLRSHRPLMLCHMQQSMEDGGETAVALHVTIHVTIRGEGQV